MSHTLFYLDIKQEYMEEQAFRKAWNEKKQQTEGVNKENDCNDGNSDFTDERRKREMGNHTWSHNN